MRQRSKLTVINYIENLNDEIVKIMIKCHNYDLKNLTFSYNYAIKSQN